MCTIFISNVVNDFMLPPHQAHLYSYVNKFKSENIQAGCFSYCISLLYYWLITWHKMQRNNAKNQFLKKINRCISYNKKAENRDTFNVFIYSRYIYNCSLNRTFCIVIRTWLLFVRTLRQSRKIKNKEAVCILQMHKTN